MFELFKRSVKRLSLVFAIFLKPKGRHAFIFSLRNDAYILDIGCGKSPNKLTNFFSKLNYVGLDIANHFAGDVDKVGTYILIRKDEFPTFLKSSANLYDAVISSHNLEHIEDRSQALDGTLLPLKANGKIFLSFPSARSLYSPTAKPYTLNYYDDPTHQALPPDVSQVISRLLDNDFKIIYVAEAYQPFLLSTIGYLLEKLRFHALFPGALHSTRLAFYGFETIIWAERKSTEANRLAN